MRKILLIAFLAILGLNNCKAQNNSDVLKELKENVVKIDVKGKRFYVDGYYIITQEEVKSNTLIIVRSETNLMSRDHFLLLSSNMIDSIIDDFNTSTKNVDVQKVDTLKSVDISIEVIFDGKGANISSLSNGNESKKHLNWDEILNLIE